MCVFYISFLSQAYFIKVKTHAFTIYSLWAILGL